MAFTYTDSLLLDRDRVRFSLGDTLSAAGPKPADANFSDAEIEGLISIEGSWQRAVAAGFETLASLWARHVTFTAEGMSSNQSDISKQYRESAIEWRDKYGYGAGSSAGTVPTIRVDAYSNDIDNITLSSETDT